MKKSNKHKIIIHSKPTRIRSVNEEGITGAKICEEFVKIDELSRVSVRSQVKWVIWKGTWKRKLKWKSSQDLFKGMRNETKIMRIIILLVDNGLVPWLGNCLNQCWHSQFKTWAAEFPNGKGHEMSLSTHTQKNMSLNGN